MAKLNSKNQKSFALTTIIFFQDTKERRGFSVVVTGYKHGLPLDGGGEVCDRKSLTWSALEIISNCCLPFLMTLQHDRWDLIKPGLLPTPWLFKLSQFLLVLGSFSEKMLNTDRPPNNS